MCIKKFKNVRSRISIDFIITRRWSDLAELSKPWLEGHAKEKLFIVVIYWEFREINTFSFCITNTTFKFIVISFLLSSEVSMRVTKFHKRIRLCKQCKRIKKSNGCKCIFQELLLFPQHHKQPNNYLHSHYLNLHLV